MLKILVISLMSLTLFSCNQKTTSAQAPNPDNNKPQANPPVTPPNQEQESVPAKHILKVGENRIITSNCEQNLKYKETRKTIPNSSDNTSTDNSLAEEKIVSTVIEKNKNKTIKNTIITELTENKISENGSTDWSNEYLEETTEYPLSGDSTVSVSSGDGTGSFVGRISTEKIKISDNKYRKIVERMGKTKDNNKPEKNLKNITVQLVYQQGDVSQILEHTHVNYIQGRAYQFNNGRYLTSNYKFSYDVTSDQSIATHTDTLLAPYIDYEDKVESQTNTTVFKKTILLDQINCEVRTQYRAQ